jgi:hypothetical protein
MRIKLLRTMLLNRPGEQLKAGTILDTTEPGAIVDHFEAVQWVYAGWAEVVREQPSKIVGER